MCSSSFVINWPSCFSRNSPSHSPCHSNLSLILFLIIFLNSSRKLTFFHFTLDLIYSILQIRIAFLYFSHFRISNPWVSVPSKKFSLTTTQLDFVFKKSFYRLHSADFDVLTNLSSEFPINLRLKVDPSDLWWDTTWWSCSVTFCKWKVKVWFCLIWFCFRFQMCCFLGKGL